MASVITNSPHKVAWLKFCHATGATDRKPLLDFVVGCFDLGIWSNMVCWPLRSAQQLTTGTSVISLGGLGTFNGTLAGTTLPTRVADGINFNSQTARIEVTMTISQPLTVVSACNFKTLQGGGSLVDGTVNRCVVWNGAGSNGRIDVFGGSSIAHTSPAFSVGWNWVGGQFNGASSLAILNGNTTAGNAGTNSLGTTVHLGNNFAPNDGAKNLDLAFVAILGIAYAAQLRDLYKTTLGQGLGLP
jgi:hypothetical protein